MGSLLNYVKAKAAKATGNGHMVFDWDKAATMIKESGAQYASAGLKSNWGFTGGDILSGGKPVAREDASTYLMSNWATPELEIFGEKHNCYKMQSKTDGWNSQTFWPESALKILNSA